MSFTITSTNPATQGCPFELRAVKTMPSLSEDSEAFTANLYMDGKKIAAVLNEGQGGPHRYEVSDQVRFDAASAWAEEKHGDYEPLDTAISELVTEARYVKLAKAHAKQGFPITVVVPCRPYRGLSEDAGPIYSESAIVGVRDSAQIDEFVKGIEEAGPHFVLTAEAA